MEFSTARFDPSTSHADCAAVQFKRLEETFEKHLPWKLETQPRGQSAARKLEQLLFAAICVAWGVMP